MIAQRDEWMIQNQNQALGSSYLHYLETEYNETGQMATSQVVIGYTSVMRNLKIIHHSSAMELEDFNSHYQ